MVRLAEEGRVLWVQEQARAREPKPAPALVPAPDAASKSEPEPAAQTSSKPKGSAGSNSVEAPRLNANAPVFFTPAYPVPTPVGRTMAAAALQFTPITPNFGYAPPMPVPPPMPGTSLHAPFPMGGAPMTNPLMHSTGGHTPGNCSNGRGQRTTGSSGVGVGVGGEGNCTPALPLVPLLVTRPPMGREPLRLLVQRAHSNENVSSRCKSHNDVIARSPRLLHRQEAPLVC
eukprot:COSAG03_NODE_1718_length_3605_cov_1.642613_4_plen_230_part_00